MQHKTTGLKTMSAAINATPPKPLLHAKRDRVGPNGQQVGTITTNPHEVDGIAIRAWQAIYCGNVKDLFFDALAFCDKYKNAFMKDRSTKLKRSLEEN